MLWSRVWIGALTGAVAGFAGWLTGPWVVPPECLETVGRTCGKWFFFELLVIPACWAAVASLVLGCVLKLLKRPRAWLVSGLGCIFWPLMWLVGGFIRVASDEVVVAFVPVVAFALAGMISGWRQA